MSYVCWRAVRIDSPFGLPRGVIGRMAGRIMLWTTKQRELLDLLDVPPGSRVLEVGYGPGALIRLLLNRVPGGATQPG